MRTIGALSGIQTLCLRIFNAYGPGQHIPASHPPVIPNFIRQSLQNGTLVFHGDANQTRDYVCDDVSHWWAASAQGVNGMVINVGSGSETSIRDLANVVIKVTGGNPEEVYNTRISGGVSRMCADLTLAKEKLDYIPLVPLEMGIRLTLEDHIKAKNGL